MLLICYDDDDDDDDDDDNDNDNDNDDFSTGLFDSGFPII